MEVYRTSATTPSQCLNRLGLTSMSTSSDFRSATVQNEIFYAGDYRPGRQRVKADSLRFIFHSHLREVGVCYSDEV